MNKIVKVLTPFKTLTDSEKRISTMILITLLLALWAASGNKYIPNPWDVLAAFPRLQDRYNLVWHFQKSLWFCTKCMAYATVIGLVVAYLSPIPLFSSFCEFLRKFRFLPSTGLSLFFLKIAGGEQLSQMQYIMVFGVTTWLIDGMVGVALGVTQDDVMYAKTLRLNRWQMLRELLIFGKGADMMLVVISTFAIAWLMLASVENIAKASGGIGVVLSENNKYLHFEDVYAIQILILVTGILIDLGLRWLRGILFPYVNT